MRNTLSLAPSPVSSSMGGSTTVRLVRCCGLNTGWGCSFDSTVNSERREVASFTSAMVEN
jgi:hypothetical protein